MGMSEFYGARDEGESIATIHRALELGVTLLDTADMYGTAHNEELVGRAIAGRRDEVVLATKFGIVRDRDDPRAAASTAARSTSRAVDGSLRRLGVDHIDLYYLHRVDPDTPIEETVGAMGELVAGGQGAPPRALRGRPGDAAPRARRAPDRRAADRVVAVVARRRGGGPARARELGVGFVAYSPLGRGFLTGAITLGRRPRRRRLPPHSPRFQGENFERNLELVRRVEELAAEKGVHAGAARAGLGPAQGDDVVPIPGTKRRSRLEENVGARRRGAERRTTCGASTTRCRRPPATATRSRGWRSVGR